MSLLIKLINTLYLKLSREGKKWVFRGIDVLIFCISIFIAFAIRFDVFDAVQILPKYKEQIILIFPIKCFFFWLSGVYRPVLRYAGLEFLGTAFIAVIGSTGLLTLSGLMLQFNPFPRSILIVDALLTLLLLVGARLFVRWLVYYAVTYSENISERENVLIYGAGEAGCQLNNAISADSHYKVIGFVDDDKQLKRQLISGITVYSPFELDKLIRKYQIDSILLAVPSIGKQERRKIIQQLQHYGIKIKTIPGMAEIISGKVSISDVRNIDIADLLGREEIKPNLELLKKNITEKSVLVTGAGGSIGSELCRQIIIQRPKRLILFESCEFALYSIDIELNENFSYAQEIEIVPCLGLVQDKDYFQKILSKYKIDTIYHAAAYKHVPIIETNIREGILNNIKGTLSCVQASLEAEVDTFVLISTDKAVRPTNVMGTTKRIAELVLQAYAKESGSNTRFVMVRFGNVLDSNGSVVPRFRTQIERGQNLTLTDKNITRYFMSIPEAARLVIQAGALGKSGNVYLLDMGEPVKIYDLAIQMIELSGLRLGVDIDIDVVGLRPGEKLYEELLIDRQTHKQTIHPKIFGASEKFIPLSVLTDKIYRLIEAAEDDSSEKMLEGLSEIVGEFNHNNGKEIINNINK